jgi:hypothetical protein
MYVYIYIYIIYIYIYLCNTIFQGDSGGPLIYNNMLIGINRGTCPHNAQLSEKVNLHLVIYLYKDFIEDITNNFN